MSPPSSPPSALALCLAVILDGDVALLSVSNSADSDLSRFFPPFGLAFVAEPEPTRNLSLREGLGESSSSSTSASESVVRWVGMVQTYQSHPGGPR